MKTFLILTILFSFSAYSSVVGISNYPLNNEGRVLSAEMTGYMSQRNEMGAGVRYNQEIERYKVFDVTASGGQDARGLTLGTGVDFELLSEDMYQPKVSIKPYFQHSKFESESSNLIGVAPSLRKGFSLNGQEFFPYFAVPTGLKINSDTEEFDYYASLSLGATMPFPGANNDKILLSLEGNANMGASSDYIGCLVSWVWK